MAIRKLKTTSTTVPATEGLVDSIKSLFRKPTPQDLKLGSISKAKYVDVSLVEKNLAEEIRATYGNDGWIKQNLATEAKTVTTSPLIFANTNGKELTTPAELIQVAESMLNVTRAICTSESPNIKLRQQLCNAATKIKSNDELDAFWLKHSKELQTYPVERQRKLYKKSMPAFGCNDQHSWPINLKNPKDVEFNGACYIKTSGKFELPTQQTASSFATAIVKLLEIATELRELESKVSIPYWDSLDSAISYDHLKHGDVIFKQLFNSQGLQDVMEFVFDVSSSIGDVVVQLYMLMFKKEYLDRKPAMENLYSTNEVQDPFTERTVVEIEPPQISEDLQELIQEAEVIRVLRDATEVSVIEPSMEGLIDSIHTLIPRLAQGFRDFTARFNPSERAPDIPKADQAFLDAVRQARYIDLAPVMVDVPEGFNDTLLNYSTSLLNAVEHAEAVTSWVNRLNVFVTKLLSHRDSRLESFSDIAKYRALEAERQRLQAELMKSFKVGSTVASRPYGDVIDRQRDWDVVWPMGQKLTAKLMQVNRKNLNASVKECAELLTRFEQALAKQEFESLSPSVLQEIAEATYQAAAEVEFFSLIYYRTMGYEYCLLKLRDRLVEVVR